MKDASKYAIVSISCLTAFALFLGYDSAILASSVSIIAALGGYTYGKSKGKD